MKASNDYHIKYRHDRGGDIRLSNAQRLLGVTLNVEEVVEDYNRIKDKMGFWKRTKLPYKSFHRWKKGESEPMYYKLADFHEYVKETLDREWIYENTGYEVD